MLLPFKIWVARALQKGGVLALAETLMSSRRRLIFTLHRVIPRAEMGECYNSYLATSPESFDHFLRWLRSRSAVLSFDELLHARSARAAACAITFDDGWEDNYRVAFPILQSHSVPAMIYIATGLIGNSRLLPEERLWHILRHATPNERTRIASKLPSAHEDSGLVGALKRLPHDKKLEFLREIRPQDGLRAVKFMDWDQIAEMRKAGHTFGSHTVNHIILPVESDETVATELSGSKQELEARFGEKVQHFAFPSGRFDQRSVQAVRAAGYATAVTTALGAVRAGYNPYLIPRLPMDNTVVNDAQEVFSPARARYSVVRGMVGSNGGRDYS